jgi:hypothetical protein
LAQSAENRWNKLRGFKLLADVIEGVKFVEGEKQEVENLDSEDRMSVVTKLVNVSVASNSFFIGLPVLL